MSMRDYAVDDYGLVIDSNIMHCLAVKLYDDCTDEEWDKDKYEFIEGVVDTLGLESIPNFVGEAFPIKDNGDTEWDDASSDFYDNDAIYYVAVSRYPNLFIAPYKDIGDLIGQFKSAIGKYLPENYAYRQNIRHIVGTYYG